MSKNDDAWLERMIERSILRGESEDFRMGRIRAKMFQDDTETEARKILLNPVRCAHDPERSGSNAGIPVPAGI